MGLFFLGASGDHGHPDILDAVDEFSGTLEELKQLVAERDIDGDWVDIAHGHQFRAKGKAKLNWFPSKGTLQYQGPTEAATNLRELLSGTPPAPSISAPASSAVGSPPSAASRKVFVVYGHDTTARTQLEAMLRRWDLEPVILDQLASEGQTVIEKLMRYSSDAVGFAVVLATPDDEGYRRSREDEKKFRARQNVILELGLLLAKLGRERVAIFIKGQDEMERPSDIQGLIYLPFVNDVEEPKLTLAKEMQKQGITLDLEKL